TRRRRREQQPGIRFRLIPNTDSRDFTVDEQDHVPGKMEILRTLEVESVDLHIASEKTARNIRRKPHALPSPRDDGAVTPVKYDTGEDLTLHRRALCFLDLQGRV